MSSGFVFALYAVCAAGARACVVASRAQRAGGVAAWRAGLTMGLLAAAATAARNAVPIEHLFDREKRQMSTQAFLERISSSHAAAELAGVPADFECSWRPLAYKYAQMLQPYRSSVVYAARHAFSTKRTPLHCYRLYVHAA